MYATAMRVFVGGCARREDRGDGRGKEGRQAVRRGYEEDTDDVNNGRQKPFTKKKQKNECKKKQKNEWMICALRFAIRISEISRAFRRVSLPSSHLVALVLEVAAKLHHGVRLGEILVGEFAAGFDGLVAHAEGVAQDILGLVPGRGDADALQVGGGLHRSRAHGSAGCGRLAAARRDLGPSPDSGHGARNLSGHLCCRIRGEVVKSRLCVMGRRERTCEKAPSFSPKKQRHVLQAWDGECEDKKKIVTDGRPCVCGRRSVAAPMRRRLTRRRR